MINNALKNYDFIYEYLECTYDIREVDKNGNSYLHNLFNKISSHRCTKWPYKIDPLSSDYIFKNTIPFQNKDGNTVYQVFLERMGDNKSHVLLTCFDRLDRDVLKEHDVFSMKNKKGETILDTLIRLIKKHHNGYKKSYKKLLTLFQYDMAKDTKKIEDFYLKKAKEEADRKAKAAANKSKYGYSSYSYGGW